MIADYDDTDTWPNLGCPWDIIYQNKNHFLHVPEEGKHYEFIEWLGVLINRIMVRFGLTLSSTAQFAVSELSELLAEIMED